MISAEDWIELLMRFRPSVVFCMVRDAALHFFTRALRDVEQNFGRVGDALNRGHHLVDRR